MTDHDQIRVSLSGFHDESPAVIFRIVKLVSQIGIPHFLLQAIRLFQQESRRQMPDDKARSGILCHLTEEPIGPVIQIDAVAVLCVNPVSSPGALVGVAVNTAKNGAAVAIEEEVAVPLHVIHVEPFGSELLHILENRTLKGKSERFAAEPEVKDISQQQYIIARFPGSLQELQKESATAFGAWAKVKVAEDQKVHSESRLANIECVTLD